MMILRVCVVVLVAAFALSSQRTSASDAIAFQVLAYHDVRDDVRDEIDSDQYAISTRRLIDHFNWLKANDFTPISVDDLLAARRGERPLPARAVLLTFDDGFISVYTHVFPLLQLFEYPAVVSVVTSWITGEVDPAEYARDDGGRQFLNWEEMREMHASGLVEIASHSHNMHRGVAANPQGNTQPAATTHRYEAGSYETDDEYFARIRDDLATSAELIEANVGVAPRVITWPYGSYNVPATEIAAELGMPVTLTLDSLPKSIDRLDAVSRHLIQANPEVLSLGFDLLHEDRPGPVRAAQVDLDYVYDPDPVQQELNLGRLLDRINALRISAVYLQAFADPDADGGAQSVYFPNRHLPMRADLFNRAAWQLETRTDVDVYAWLPILSFESAGIDPQWRILQERDGQAFADPEAEPRLSPFSADARRVINEIYEDLARAAPVDGILFHDDGRMNEFEDASRFGREARMQMLAGMRPGVGVEDIDSSEESTERRWARLKTQSIIDLTDELMATVHRWQPVAKSARNIFATALLYEGSEHWLAQDYSLFLDTYDHVALMAMPWFENAANHEEFYTRLLTAMDAQPLGREKTVFELQTVDWRTSTNIAAEELRRTMRWLQANGVRHLAYYPDDFILGHPQLRPLRQGMSLARYPIEVPQ